MRDDLKSAIRSLLHSRGFTVVALTVLALGIGAGTAIFSVVDAVVLRGLPFDEHDRLVAVLEYDTRRPETFGAGRTTPQSYLDWRRLQESFEAVAGSATRRRCGCAAKRGNRWRRRGSALPTSSSRCSASHRSSAAPSRPKTKSTAAIASRS